MFETQALLAVTTIQLSHNRDKHETSRSQQKKIYIYKNHLVDTKMIA